MTGRLFNRFISIKAQVEIYFEAFMDILSTYGSKTEEDTRVDQLSYRHIGNHANLPFEGIRINFQYFEYKSSEK